MQKLIGWNSGIYMILDRPGEKTFKDEPRMGDMCILCHPAQGYKQKPLELQKVLKFMPGWEDLGHNETIMDELLALPEKESEK